MRAGMGATARKKVDEVARRQRRWTHAVSIDATSSPGQGKVEECTCERGLWAGAHPGDELQDPAELLGEGPAEYAEKQTR